MAKKKHNEKNSLYSTIEKEINENIVLVEKDDKPPRLFDHSMDDMETLGWLASRFRALDDARPDSDWELRYKQFMSFIAWREDGRANINLPIEYSTIENKMADILSLKPIVTFLPTEKSDVSKVEVYKKLWDFTWVEADTDEALYDLVLGTLIFGTGFWFEGVHKESYRRYIPTMRKDGTLDKKAVQQTKSWLRGFAWDIRYVWVDTVNNLKDATDCFLQEVDISKEQLEALQYDPNYNADAIAAYLDSFNGELGDQDSTRYKSFITEEEEQDVENRKYSLMHYYNKQKGIYVVTDHNFNFILREGANPYPHGELPISILVDHKNYQSLYGRGECELLENTKYERNTIRNQLLDFARESNTMNLAVGENVQLEDMEMINGVIRQINFTGNIGDMQYIKPPTADRLLTELDGMLQQDATMITGIDNNALVGSPQKTAFEAKLQEQTKLKRIYLFLRQMDFFYQRMAEQRMANMQFYLPITTGKRILGEGSALDNKRTIALVDTEAEDIMDVDDQGDIVPVGKKFKEAKGETAFLEIEPSMIQSNLDVQVVTPTTTPILRELNKQDLQEVLNQIVQVIQLGTPQSQEIAQEINLKAILDQAIENIGFDPEKFQNKEEKSSERADLRQSLVEDLPAPMKPAANNPELNQPSQMQQMPGLPPIPERGGNLNV